ncbi:MAG: insulinase family protein [Ruminococcus sp.]|nr:insulinase family protein [Ruminococcus sp.]
MKYERTELADNIGYSSVIDEKFKTSFLTVRFITVLGSRTAAANALGISSLSSSSRSYDSIAKLNEKLSALYGASLSSFTRKRGDVQILGLSSSWINSRFAIDGEDLDVEMLEIVKGCIFDPNASEGEFEADSFRITKKDLLDRIDAELNNKRGYAISRASEVAYRGEPAENSCYGTKETAEAVSAKEAFEAYKRLLETAQIEIYYISSEKNDRIPEMLREAFAGINRTPEKVVFDGISPVKEELAEVSDEFDVNQCKMVMNFKTDCRDKYALKFVSTIFGETPVSKLFVNVREKLSLCYYCACRMVSSKGTLMVDSGVEKNNIKKARTEILAQLEEICRGNITDDEIQSAMLSFENSLSQVGDVPSSYETYYFEQFCSGNIITPAERLAEYKAVTKERIIEAAKSLKPDSVYLMLNKEAE